MEFLRLPYDRQVPIIVSDADGALKGNAVLVHGIFSEKNEDGRFVRLAERLASRGIRSTRFDYTGHGEHSYPSDRLTIASALADCVAVVSTVASVTPAVPLYIIGSSFGGSLALLYLQLAEAMRPERIVLLNPVTDYRCTFLEPQGSTMREIFSPDRLRKLRKTGAADMGNGFVLTLPLLLEFEFYKPYESFEKLSQPTLVVHGDRDSYVPFDVTKQQATVSPLVTFETIQGADHAFVEPEYEAESFRLILDFLS
jgi:pimeloyl-ACP methyl ester carboxylesterase